MQNLQKKFVLLFARNNQWGTRRDLAKGTEWACVRQINNEHLFIQRDHNISRSFASVWRPHNIRRIYRRQDCIIKIIDGR